MRARQRRSTEASQRVAEFVIANKAVLGPLDTTPAGQQLADANARIASLSVAQSAAERTLSGHSSTQQDLARALREQHMQPIAKFARAKLRGVPGYAALTKSAHGIQGTGLVAAALGMATAAQPYAAELAQAQFPPDAVDQLVSTANAMSAVITSRQTTRVARVQATADLKEQIRRAREAVAMLDPIVTRKLADQPGLLAGWRSAKRISASPTTAAVAPATPVAPAVQAVPAVHSA
jgi:hypothetical protein